MTFHLNFSNHCCFLSSRRSVRSGARRRRYLSAFTFLPRNGVHGSHSVMGWKKKPQHGRVRRACDASGMDRSLHVTCEWQWHGLHRRTLLLADLKHAGGSIENSPRLRGAARTRRETSLDCGHVSSVLEGADELAATIRLHLGARSTG